MKNKLKQLWDKRNRNITDRELDFLIFSSLLVLLFSYLVLLDAIWSEPLNLSKGIAIASLGYGFCVYLYQAIKHFKNFLDYYSKKGEIK